MLYEVITIPALLNMHSIPYSGNPLEAMFTTTSKGLTHKVLVKEGIKTPGTYTPSMHRLLTPGKKYIIKPVWEDGSMGITMDSVFTFDPAVSNRITSYNVCYTKLLRLYSDQPWFIISH